MHRIDAPGATVGKLFTEGNPALSIPATEVSDDWLNDIQEELANFIESQGIALIKGNQIQLTAALNLLLGAGGVNIKLDPLLNNTADQVVAGLVFDKAFIKAAIIHFDIHRETATQNVQETGILVATHNSKDDVWRISLMQSSFDDAETAFNITAAGQVRATTTDFTGAAYAAQLRITAVQRFAL